MTYPIIFFLHLEKQSDAENCSRNFDRFLVCTVAEVIMVELGLEVAMLSQHVVLGYVPVVVDEAKYVGSHLVRARIAFNRYFARS